jgi:hypothetical protein
MAILAVEAVLLSDLPQLISAEEIGRLSSEKVEELASRPPNWQRERKELEAQMTALEEVLQICNENLDSQRELKIKTHRRLFASILIRIFQRAFSKSPKTAFSGDPKAATTSSAHEP